MCMMVNKTSDSQSELSILSSAHFMALRCCCRSDNDVYCIEIVDTKQSVLSESLTDVHESQLDEISIRSTQSRIR